MQMSEEVRVRKPEQVIEIYSEGWTAMEWLAQHAKANSCRECAAYHRAVESGRKARDVVRLRCRLAQVQHGKYMKVTRLRQELADSMECFLTDGRSPCYGPAEWIVARRRKIGRQAGHAERQGDLIDYQIGCKRHAEKAEARAVISGDAASVSIERLDSLSTEEAKRMA